MYRSFNLLEQPWVPLRDQTGALREVSLWDALAYAQQWQRIEHASPLAEVALHRLLLAVLHRALGGPRDEEEALKLWKAGEFPRDALRKYLECHQDRFDLFHPQHPFYQVPDLPEENPLPWTKLLPERASGNNPTLFDHSTDGSPASVQPADAAIALLVHQAFSPGGLLRRMGVPSVEGAPLATAAVFLPLGETLFHTLLLNLPPYNPSEWDDAPIWEVTYHAQDLGSYKTVQPLRGRTRIYTWLARGVRLLPEIDGSIRYMAYGPGVKPATEKLTADPMCAYHLDPKQGTVPVRLRQDRGFWRDLDSLLAGQGHTVPRVVEWAQSLLYEAETGAILMPTAVLGQIADRAKVLEIRREVYPLPRDLSQETAAEIRQAVHQAEETGQKLRGVGINLAQELLALSRQTRERNRSAEAKRLAESLPLLPVYWTALDTSFPEFLTRLARGQDHREFWRATRESAVRLAWNTTKAPMGVGSRHIAALVRAEGRLLQILSTLRRMTA